MVGRVCAVVVGQGAPGCGEDGVHCFGTADQLFLAGHEIAMPADNMTCAGDSDAADILCFEASPFVGPLEDLAPFAGGSGNGQEICAWNATDLACTGGTSVLEGFGPPRPCVVDVDVGANFACVTTGEPRVDCLGSMAATSTFPDRVLELGAGTGHVCARTTAGEVWCWGDGRGGELGTGIAQSSRAPLLAALGGRRAIALEAGHHHGCAIVVDEVGAEHVACWGLNDSGQSCSGCELPAVFEPSLDDYPTFP